MALSNRQMRYKLISQGVSNLKEFGYPAVNRDNILTDTVFKKFFEGMLKENKGISPDYDPVIDELLKEIQKD